MALFVVLVSMSAPDASRAEASRRYTGPIIDMHMHAYADADFWGPAPNPATGMESVASAAEHRQRCVELMREHRVVLAVIDENKPGAVAPWVELLGADRVIAASSDEYQPIDEFERDVASGRIELFGEVEATYQGRSPADPTLMPYYAIAEKYGIPAAVHTGGSFPGITRRNKRFRMRFGDPLLLEDVLVAHPDLKLYLMHAGTHFYDRAAVMMVQYPDLYVDIGVLAWIPDARKFLEPFLKLARHHEVLDRVMFGSDQMVWPEAIELSIATIQSLDLLTLAEKQGIFYDNAARFLGLGEDEIARHHATGGPRDPS